MADDVPACNCGRVMSVLLIYRLCVLTAFHLSSSDRVVAYAAQYSHRRYFVIGAHRNVIAIRLWDSSLGHVSYINRA